MNKLLSTLIIASSLITTSAFAATYECSGIKDNHLVTDIKVTADTNKSSDVEAELKKQGYKNISCKRK
ncbi:hypothetical protein [Psychrobacter sp. I-STPA10]|uniref:hypothetical protein n=1 Tax=Psychrobacter sp. I-STPA10 TaxID=2585769 RepID=UPI001E356F2F|nr:hypothetical protein [Psychrobacter sp. I-STPA10]